ncbi:hypothetical protein PIB30_064442, partial [Stylosanthes scabra]|nr:hypothetical protein [Stylosanthes scabra]
MTPPQHHLFSPHSNRCPCTPTSVPQPLLPSQPSTFRLFLSIQRRKMNEIVAPTEKTNETTTTERRQQGVHDGGERRGRDTNGEEKTRLMNEEETKCRVVIFWICIVCLHFCLCIDFQICGGC